MLHPSYSDLMKVVNSEVEPGEAPVVNSRYSIVMATSKRARQIIGGDEPMVKAAGKKPLSVAIDELNQNMIWMRRISMKTQKTWRMTRKTIGTKKNRKTQRWENRDGKIPFCAKMSEIAMECIILCS